MLFLLLWLIIAASHAFGQADTPPTPTPIGSYVTRANIYVRGGPGEQYQPVGSLSAGAALFPLSRNENGTWVLIRYFRGFGWVRRDLGFWRENIDALPVMAESDLTPTFEPGSETATPFFATATPVGNWITSRQGVFVRTGPGLRFPVYGELRGGDAVNPVGRSSDTSWILLRLESGFAWINRRLVSWTIDLETLPVLQINALTPSATFTRTLTPTRTPTTTITPSPTNTPTLTPSLTLTWTAVPPSATLTLTNTPTPTDTVIPPSATDTSTAVPPTNTLTWTPIPPTATYTATVTPSLTHTPSVTATPVPPTETYTSSVTPSLTHTPSVTATPIPPTATYTATVTPSLTHTPSVTATPVTPTETPTFSATPTATVTPSLTLTPLPIVREVVGMPTDAPTLAPSSTASATRVPPTTTDTATAARTATITRSWTPTRVPPTATDTASITPSATMTRVTPTTIVLIAPPVTTPAPLMPETSPELSPGGVPTELIVGGVGVLLVVGYLGLYWRGAAGVERYKAGFMLDRCPVCERGSLYIERSVQRTIGIPRARFIVRCSECRSVLREAGNQQWRYAIDRVENPTLYSQYNNRVLDDRALSTIGRQAEGRQFTPYVRPPVNPPTFVDDEET